MGYEFQGHLVMFTHREKDIIVKVDQKFLVYMEELKLAFDSPTLLSSKFIALATSENSKMRLVTSVE